MKKAKDSHIFQLKIMLSGSNPAIWRRFLVDSRVRLSQLHDIIQILMGWENSHLHQYRQRNIIYSEPIDDMDETFGSKYIMLDESDYRLNQVLTKLKDKIIYEYDFGDSWDHELVLEKFIGMDKNINYPVCLEGAMACPPEDCGGIGGYYDMLEIIKDPENSEYENMMDWLGGEFDANEFNLVSVNIKLKNIKIT